MTLQVCDCCGTKCAADLTCCPHCSGTDLHEEGTVPKITVHGGPTDAADIPTATEVREHPGTGVEMEEVEMTPDGEGGFVGEISNDGSGEALPPADEAPESTSTDESEAEGNDTNSDVEPDAEPAAAALRRPATNASKADWVAYVEALGEDPGDLTKAELIELYG